MNWVYWVAGLWIWLPTSPLGVLLYCSIWYRTNSDTKVPRLALQKGRLGGGISAN